MSTDISNPRTSRNWFGRLRSRLTFWHVVTGLSLLVFVLLLIYPVFNLLISSIVGGADSGSSWYAPYVELFTRRLYYESLINSLIIAAAATLGALLLGVPLAYFVSRFAVPGKIFLRSALILTFVSPPLIGAYAWIVIFGQQGVLRKFLVGLGIDAPSIYGWPGMIIVLTLQGVPYIFLFLSSALKTVDQSIEDAGVNLGYKRSRVAVSAIFPLLKPALSSSAMLVFVTAFADFGTPRIIGQNVRVYPRLVYQSFTSEVSQDYSLASSLAVVMLVVTVLALYLQRRYAQRHSYGQEMIRPLGVLPAKMGTRMGVSFYAYFVVLLAAVPIMVVFVSSFLEFSGSTLTWKWTLENYLEAPGLLSALTTTLVIATIATLLAVVAGSFIGYVVARVKGLASAAIDFFAAVPFAVPGVVFGIAFSIAFGSAPFFLAGTAVILVLAYFIRRLPFTVRSVSSQLNQMGSQVEEASINLGVPPGRTFMRVTLPVVAPAVASGALLTWATVVKEFNATVILYGPSTRTLSIEIMQQITRGNFQYASAVGATLILMALIPIVILFAVSSKDEEVLI